MIIGLCSIHLNLPKIVVIKIFFYIVIASDLLPCIFCLFGLKNLRARDIRFFFIYLCVLAIFSLSLLVLREFGYRDTYGLKLQTVYPIFEITLVSLFFYQVFRTKYKSLILFSGATALIFLFFISFLKPIETLPFLPLVLEEIFFLLVILYFFYEKIKYITETPLYTIPNFWVALGFLTYFSGTFFLYLISISVENKDAEYRQQYNFVVACFSVLKNALFCVAIYTNKIKEMLTRKSVNPDIHFDDYANPLSKTSNSYS